MKTEPRMKIRPLNNYPPAFKIKRVNTKTLAAIILFLIPSVTFGQGYNPTDSLKIMAVKCTRNGSLMEWDIAVQNFADSNIKDVEFELVYLSESGTVVDRGTETSYTIFPHGDTSFVRLKEFAHSQTVKCDLNIKSAKWESEPGQKNLDW